MGANLPKPSKHNVIAKSWSSCPYESNCVKDHDAAGLGKIPFPMGHCPPPNSRCVHHVEHKLHLRGRAILRRSPNARVQLTKKQICVTTSGIRPILTSHTKSPTQLPTELRCWASAAMHRCERHRIWVRRQTYQAIAPPASELGCAARARTLMHCLPFSPAHHQPTHGAVTKAHPRRTDRMHPPEVWQIRKSSRAIYSAASARAELALRFGLNLLAARRHNIADRPRWRRRRRRHGIAHSFHDHMQASGGARPPTCIRLSARTDPGQPWPPHHCTMSGAHPAKVKAPQLLAFERGLGHLG